LIEPKLGYHYFLEDFDELSEMRNKINH